MARRSKNDKKTAQQRMDEAGYFCDETIFSEETLVMRSGVVMLDVLIISTANPALRIPPGLCGVLIDGLTIRAVENTGPNNNRVGIEVCPEEVAAVARALRCRTPELKLVGGTEISL